MNRERQRQNLRTTTAPVTAPAVVDQEETALIEILEEFLPASDEQAREALERHRTEGQGE